MIINNSIGIYYKDGKIEKYYMNCDKDTSCKHNLWILDHVCDDFMEDWYKCIKCGYCCWFYPNEVKSAGKYYTLEEGTKL